MPVNRKQVCLVNILKGRVIVMSEYKLKTPKAAKAVVETEKKIEDAVVGAYKKVEDTVVGAYKKVEGKFVDAFLEKADDTGEQDGGPQGT